MSTTRETLSFEGAAHSAAAAEDLRADVERLKAALEAEIGARKKAETDLGNRVREQAAIAALGVTAMKSENFYAQVECAAGVVARALEVEICIVAAVNAARDTVEVLSSEGWVSPPRTLKFSDFPKTTLLHAALSRGGISFSDINGPLTFVAEKRLHDENVKSGIVECSTYGDNARIVIYLYSRAVREFTQGESYFLRTIGNAIAILQDRQASLDRLQLRERALEAISQGITITDETAAQPSLIYTNPALQRMTGFAAEELLGRPSRDLLADKNDEMLNGRLALARTKKRAIRFEAKIRRKSGEDFVAQVVGSPITAEDGSMTHSVIVIDDVTEARRRDEQLHGAQKMEAVGQLTGGIAHDFNNLLTVIKANAEELLEGFEKEDIKHRQLAMLLQAANRGADLVQQLMAFARKQELEPTAIDVNQLLSTFGKLISHAVPENIRLFLKRTEKLPAVLADRSRLETALLNLCLNARDAMPEGGTLAIETQKVTIDKRYAAEHVGATAGDYVMIAVTDSGHGMAKDVVDRAFQPFFTTKEVGKGTGLGLSMVYGFVKQSGGYAEIQSDVGTGTTIRLFLPPAQTAAVEVAPAAAVPASASATGQKVLLVEDHELVRQTAQYGLRRLGFTVTPVASADEAMRVLEKGETFDLVFTDIIMPGAMNGADLTREIMHRWPGTRVLMTSGYTEASALGKVQMPEGVRMLSKPYANAALAQTIQEVMAAPPAKA